MGKSRFGSEIRDGDRLLSLKYRAHSFLIEIKDMRRFFTLLPASRERETGDLMVHFPFPPTEPGGEGNGKAVIHRDRDAINYRVHAQNCDFIGRSAPN